MKLRKKFLSWIGFFIKAKRSSGEISREHSEGRNAEAARLPFHDTSVSFTNDSSEPTHYPASGHTTDNRGKYRLEMIPNYQQTCLPKGGSSQEDLPSGRAIITTLPSELVYKIATFMDDVGFVCFRNAHPRLRDVLSIDQLSITPCGKYIIRGIMGLHNIPNPVIRFCPQCTMQSSHWIKYPDRKPSMAAIKLWRKNNVLAGMTTISIRRSGHFCDIGFRPRKAKRNPSPAITPILDDIANYSFSSLAPIVQEYFPTNET